jgi:acetyl esterase/lipase
MSAFHPELRRVARLIPRFSFTPRLARLAKAIQRWRGVPKPPAVEGVAIRDILVPGPEGGGPVRVRLYTPQNVVGAVPVLVWIHGGGFIIGSPEQDEANNISIVRELGIAVAAVAYRLAPEHPFPAPLEDCYAALRWLHAGAAALGLKRDRIAIGGASAGGGLAAGLVLMAHDRKQVPVAFQLLLYPMLDDRTATRTDIDQSHLRLWNTKSNVYGWSAYLGREPGSDGVHPHAVPARRENLTGLPPAWIGVGTLDLFHGEDVAFAQRLNEAGVPCALQIVEGAFHAFDVMGAKTAVAQGFRGNYTRALRQALFKAI